MSLCTARLHLTTKVRNIVSYTKNLITDQFQICVFVFSNIDEDYAIIRKQLL